MDWPRLVEEHREWEAHNFPDSKLPKPQESILGMTEEVGELAHSHLKELQNIRGTPEEHQANARDAIGDITIYLLGVLDHLEYLPGMYSTEQRPEDAFEEFNIFNLAELTGHLGRVVGPFPERAASFCEGIIDALAQYCSLRGWDYEEIVLETWARVSKRDWQKDPVAGGEVLHRESETDFGGSDALV